MSLFDFFRREPLTPPPPPPPPPPPERDPGRILRGS